MMCQHIFRAKLPGTARHGFTRIPFFFVLGLFFVSISPLLPAQETNGENEETPTNSRSVRSQYEPAHEHLSDLVTDYHRENQWVQYLIRVRDGTVKGVNSSKNIEALIRQTRRRENGLSSEISDDRQFIKRMSALLETPEQFHSPSSHHPATVPPWLLLRVRGRRTPVAGNGVLGQPFRPVSNPYGPGHPDKRPSFQPPEWMKELDGLGWARSVLRHPLFRIRERSSDEVTDYNEHQNILRVPEDHLRTVSTGLRKDQRIPMSKPETKRILRRFLGELFLAYYDLFLETGHPAAASALVRRQNRRTDLFLDYGPQLSEDLHAGFLSEAVSRILAVPVRFRRNGRNPDNAENRKELRKVIRNQLKEVPSITPSFWLPDSALSENLINGNPEEDEYRLSNRDLYRFFRRVIHVPKQWLGEPPEGNREPSTLACHGIKDAPRCWMVSGRCPCEDEPKCRTNGCLHGSSSPILQNRKVVNENKHPIMMDVAGFRREGGTDGPDPEDRVSEPNQGTFMVWGSGTTDQNDGNVPDGLRACWLHRTGRVRKRISVTDDSAVFPHTVRDPGSNLILTSWVTGKNSGDIQNYLNGTGTPSGGIQIAAYEPMNEEPVKQMAIQPVPKTFPHSPTIVPNPTGDPVLVWEEFQFRDGNVIGGNLVFARLHLDRERVGTARFLIRPLPSFEPHRTMSRTSAAFDQNGNLLVAWGTPAVPGNVTRILVGSRDSMADPESHSFVPEGNRGGYPAGMQVQGEDRIELIYHDYSQFYLTGSDLLRLKMNTDTGRVLEHTSVTGGPGFEWSPSVVWSGERSGKRPLVGWGEPRFATTRQQILLKRFGKDPEEQLPVVVSSFHRPASNPGLVPLINNKTGMAWIEWTGKSSRIRYVLINMEE